MYIEKTKEKYRSFKNILTILESGDIRDERYKLLIKSLTVENVEQMRVFVDECQDKGIQYLYETN